MKIQNLDESTTKWLVKYMDLFSGSHFSVDDLMNVAVEQGWDSFEFMAMERGDNNVPERWVVRIDTEWDPDPPLYDHDSFLHEEVLGSGSTKIFALISALKQAADSLKEKENVNIW